MLFERGGRSGGLDATFRVGLLLLLALLADLHVIQREAPVDEFVEKCVDVARALVLVIEIIGVLPYVE